MELRLDDWMERFAFFAGCYYDVAATATLERLLRQGDCYIDVGANLGFLALTAARAVGPEGKVLAFEPNVTTAARLNRVLRANRIDNVSVFENALGNADGSANLDTGTHSGTSNLRAANPVGTVVKVLRGDNFVANLNPETWVLTKVDVEGYEQRVLEGFKALIKRPKTAFLVEVTDQWLRELGGSADELLALLQQQGFQAYLPSLSPTGAVRFSPIDRACDGRHQYDLLFLRPLEAWLSR